MTSILLHQHDDHRQPAVRRRQRPGDAARLIRDAGSVPAARRRRSLLRSTDFFDGTAAPDTLVVLIDLAGRRHRADGDRQSANHPPRCLFRDRDRRGRLPARDNHGPHRPGTGERTLAFVGEPAHPRCHRSRHRPESDPCRRAGVGGSTAQSRSEPPDQRGFSRACAISKPRSPVGGRLPTGSPRPPCPSRSAPPCSG